MDSLTADRNGLFWFQLKWKNNLFDYDGITQNLNYKIYNGTPFLYKSLQVMVIGSDHHHHLITAKIRFRQFHSQKKMMRHLPTQRSCIFLLKFHNWFWSVLSFVFLFCFYCGILGKWLFLIYFIFCLLQY